MKRSWIFVVLALFFVTATYAQESTSTSTEEGCTPDSLDFSATDLSTFGGPEAATASTEAEVRVREIIAQEGVHVVHFWAPWCGNSIAELRDGWYALVEENPDVTFTFVTVWNDGESGQPTLQRYAIPDRVVELTQPDFGPSTDETQRRRTFLDLPVTWIPATWIFNDNGELAFALNYGEMSMETIQTLIDVAEADWDDD